MSLFIFSVILAVIYVLICRKYGKIPGNFRGIPTQHDNDRKDDDKSCISAQPPNNIVAVLRIAAQTSGCLRICESGENLTSRTVSYKTLFEVAQANASRLRTLPGWKPGRVCLIYLDDHYNNVVWFWSVLLAGGIPSVSALSAPQDAQAKMQHLRQLLSDPLCLTTGSGLNLTECEQLQTYGIESLESGSIVARREFTEGSHIWPPMATAAIMLTSGSSGNAKAVPLSHQQILSCLKGKASALPCDPDTTILNWVSMDHVAGLIEGHIRGLFECIDQVLVKSSDIISNPAIFIELLWRHKVSSSFAPNFLLSTIVDGVESQQLKIDPSCDLRHLRYIASGGEACITDTCHRLTSILQRYGAPGNVITPGFGMTETCAGCIFNRSCPSTDLDERYKFTSVGRCMPGVEMRITPLNDVDAASAQLTADDVVGNLEIRGDVVFRGYLNNTEANAASFTSDGWFRTGDMGFVDSHRNLVLTGRTKEVICINGVKYLPVDLERIIEEAQVPGVTPGFIVCFASRPIGASTEQCFVVYQHSYAFSDRSARANAQQEISRALLFSTGSRPQILPLPPGVLQKSTLGKLLRARVSKAVEQGLYAEEAASNAAMLGSTAAALAQPSSRAEEVILGIIASQLQLKASEIGVDTPFIDAGITSVDLIQMRSKLSQEFHHPTLSIKTLITHGTVRALTRVIVSVTSEGDHGPPSERGLSSYKPAVQLKTSGSKTPLWLVHPGVGEVLVFVGLSQHIQSRPVYALRARGFEEGETVFGSIDEAVTVYMGAIRAEQPYGPYALAGYSYGSMLAFEISKRLEAEGEEVGFLGCFNLPPHIKSRMRQMSAQNCLLHLAQFLQLIDPTQAEALEVQASDLTFDRTMDLLLSAKDYARWRDLDLSRDGLARWARVAYSLQNLAIDYEPMGSVQNMDVFYCEPLAFAARSKEEWLHVHLSRWRNFCRSPPAYHSVSGAHYTMLSPQHVRSFQRDLETAMAARGV